MKLPILRSIAVTLIVFIGCAAGALAQKSVGVTLANTEKRDITSKKIGQVKPPNIECRLTFYKGENHNSVRLTSFPAGLYWVYQSPATTK